MTLAEFTVALDNLLANALDALTSGGVITVTARTTGSQAQLEVRDNGPGMNAQQRHAAFRRFATGGGGAGLGLAIVDRLATANGGSAVLSDTPGGGLTVTLEIPRRDTTGAAGTVALAGSHTSGPASSGRS